MAFVICGWGDDAEGVALSRGVDLNPELVRHVNYARNSRDSRVGVLHSYVTPKLVKRPIGWEVGAMWRTFRMNLTDSSR
jgi:hypothetical protein